MHFCGIGLQGRVSAVSLALGLVRNTFWPAKVRKPILELVADATRLKNFMGLALVRFQKYWLLSQVHLVASLGV